METIMDDNRIRTLEQVRRFLEGTADVEFSIDTKRKRYEWIEETLKRFRYLERCKSEKGLLLKFLEKVSGYSHVQVKRFVRQYFLTGHVRRRKAKKRGFIRKYTDADISLLAETDDLHGTLSGPATKKVCERSYTLFGETAYERLAAISVAHLYNLRRSAPYRRIRIHFTKTRPTPVAIGERRRPRPDGRPGYIRVDTVHQGDLDGNKGVYYINAVDEVTQFEIVCAVEKISENYLIPVLELLLEQFPFVILGFHSDNGSEYINRSVAALLNKLLIELTKSRPRHSNDNALAESKNGSIVRKHLGYSHIPQRFAPLINRFLIDHLNPYVNFHRPCFFPEIVTDHRGKQSKRYPYDAMMTPFDKLKSLKDAQQFLKPSVSLDLLDDLASQISDNESAKRLNNAKFKLFDTINEQISKLHLDPLP